MPVLPGAPAVHLLGAKTARRRGKCRLHRVLAGKGSEEFKEDLEALSLEDSLTLPPLRSEKVAAGKILEQFAHGASIGYGSVFCTGQDVPPGLHPQGKKTDASTIYDVRLFRKQHVPVTKLGCQRGEAT